jgi:putative transposase
MEIVVRENACFVFLNFVSIKMELHWKSDSGGKVRNNLPF